VWHHFVLRVSDRDAAQRHFEELGVSTDVHYPYFFNSVGPLSKYVTDAPLPRSRQLAGEVLSFPISPMLTDDDVTQVADAMACMPRGFVATR
jgi:dTDP-4-amino-4,6-dideoxygalactose transaminase